MCSLQVPLARYEHSTLHDDLLFLSMFLTAVFGLMCLGELVFPDDQSLRDWRKITRWASVCIRPDHYEFKLPTHKADHPFEGCRILIAGERFGFPSRQFFLCYLASCDIRFPLGSPLWLTALGAVPSQTFFMLRLRNLLPESIFLFLLSGPPHINCIKTPQL
jgi:hypothetical protein